MSKLGIGVGEEFPVEEPAPQNPGPPDGPRHRSRGHRVFRFLAKLGVVAFVIGAVSWMFHGHGFHDGAYAAHMHAHHGFFPFFPLLLIAAFAVFAFRRGCGGRHRHHYYSNEPRKEA